MKTQIQSPKRFDPIVTFLRSLEKSKQAAAFAISTFFPNEPLETFADNSRTQWVCHESFHRSKSYTLE